ncbi:hypothetical protein ACPWT1_15590 [Ramlibacter sp. MMS24-I3-19]|uniref:hypothetical protein n=1 Tax=Ramlibacter sp. MMS24-I3-19 TaxID=3416606 RepID=UPI003D0575D5
MTHRFIAAALLAALAGVAQAQSGTSLGSLSTQTPPPGAGSETLPPGPAQRSLPSRPSTASVPSVSGGGMNTPDSSGVPGSSSIGSTIDPNVGGSGSAGLAAMGGGMDMSGAPAREMGSGAMTDCPMGTTRKMGLCVPHGQARKKQP